MDELRIPPDLLKELGRPVDVDLYQGSMGIYVFNRQVLIDALADDHDDFGKHTIPASLQNYKVFAYIFQGYWEDIGTVRAFFEANLAPDRPGTGVQLFLTAFIPSIPNGVFCRPARSVERRLSGRSADGCVITAAHIDRAVIGIRSVIESGTTIRNSILMGADFYQDEAPEPKPGTPPLGVGRRCHIEGAIIDKSARIGEGVVITPEGKPADADGENYYIRDGVVVVPKSAVVPDGTVT